MREVARADQMSGTLPRRGGRSDRHHHHHRVAGFRQAPVIAPGAYPESREWGRDAGPLVALSEARGEAMKHAPAVPSAPGSGRPTPTGAIGDQAPFSSAPFTSLAPPSVRAVDGGSVLDGPNTCSGFERLSMVQRAGALSPKEREVLEAAALAVVAQRPCAVRRCLAVSDGGSHVVSPLGPATEHS